MKNRFPVKTTLTLLAFGILILLPHVVPTLQEYRSLDPKQIPEVAQFPVHNLPEPAAASPVNPPEGAADEVNLNRLFVGAPRNLVDPAHVLDSFYESLLKGGVTTILHYGDSPTTADLITADVRNMLQREFGDAGSGFVLIARPWAWYGHRGVEMQAANWKIDVASFSPWRDGLDGLGAVSFQGQAGAVANWTLRDSTHTTMEIAYLAEPGGGEFSVEADEEIIGTASTVSETRSAGFARFDIPAGASRFRLRVTKGQVRLYGADFRRGEAGVVYSSLGVNGANVTLLSHALNEAHWAEELRHYRPNLVIVNYGTNESGFTQFVDTVWAKEMREVVQRLQDALPGVAILLMSPMDRGVKQETGEIDTLASIPRLVNIESKVARETGVAFFNTFEAMGGQGTMGRWYTAEPRLVGADFIHPMPAGAKIVGQLLFTALRDGFNHYKMQELKQKIAKLDAEAAAMRQRP
jgi:lysophospholipase L1-like esterase